MNVVRDSSVAPAPPRRLDPFGFAALVASGTLAAHQLGYVVDADARAAHTYFAVLGPVVLLAAFVAAWSTALQILRRGGGTLPSVRSLAAMQVAAYGLMEVVERAVTGESLTSLASLPVALGLIAQPLVAYVALRILRVGERLLRTWIPAALVAPTRTVPAWDARASVCIATSAVSAVRPRGPPVLSI